MTLRQYLGSSFPLAKDLANFAKGYWRYLLRKERDMYAYLMMRRLFCATNGWVNDTLALLHGATHPPYRVDTSGSLIRGLDREQIGRVVRHLDRDGYHIFEQRLPDDVCDRLVDFALRTPFALVQETGERGPRLCFDADNPVAIKYDADPQDVIEDPLAQQVIGDPGLLALAQAYFRAKAVQDMLAMWWSTPSSRPSSAAAQLFHFDMDRVKFLKFFVYLTDVTPETGPHCYIAGSHRRLPRALRQDRRLTDEEVFAHYPREKRVEITGPKGTLCAVDTRGLHKGKGLLRGHRLIFQVEFAINLFGMTYPPLVLTDNVSAEFRALARKYPYAFANYVPGARNGSSTAATLSATR